MSSGIYKIENKINGCIYIGSAVDIESRFSVHKHYLKNGNHQNKFLQRAWNKYKENLFSFEVIEFVEIKENLIEREQFWIDEYLLNGNSIYNICLKAGSSLGRVFSQESRLKMSASQSKRKHTKASKEKMSSQRKGKKFSEEHKAKISASSKGRTVSLETKEKLRMAWVARKARGIIRDKVTGRFKKTNPEQASQDREYEQRWAA